MSNTKHRLKPYPAYKESEMAWLGKVPIHWLVAETKNFYEIQMGKMLQSQPAKTTDIEVPYLKAVNIQWYSVQTDNSQTMWASPEEIKQLQVTPGDLLVCEGGEGGRAGIVQAIPNGFIIQNALHRVRPKRAGRNELLQHLMKVISETGWFDAINNKATIAHFTKETFASLPIPVPSIEEQAAIVRYLDDAEQRIRTYVSAKERLIALLEEERQAVIHQAVTKGLDPNVKLKPSGVEWLGDVPEHWDVIPVKRAFMSIDYGISESASDSGTIRLLTMGHVKDGKVIVPHAGGVESVDGYLLLNKGDLLFNRTNSQELVGKVGLYEGNESPVTFASYLVRLRPSSTHESEFLNLALNDTSFISRARREAIPSLHQSNLNPTRYGRIHISLPSRAEQGAILHSLSKKTKSLIDVIDRARRQIELMEEYRSRLIADVVTGKIDVREAKP